MLICRVLAIFLWLFSICDCHVSYVNYTGLLNSLVGTGSGYDVTARPVSNQEDAVTIDANVSLVSLSRLDAVDQTIELNLYFNFEWTDELLVWDPLVNSNIQTISAYSNAIWMPSCHLANSLGDDSVNLVDMSISFPVMVKHTGRMTWSPPVQVETSCQLDMTMFPRDQHNCTFFFLVNGYTETEVRWKVNIDDFAQGLASWFSDGQWEVVNYTLAVTPFSFFGVAKSALVLDITFRRLPTYFLLNILVPTIALSFLNILVFGLPVSSGEKVSFSITVLLSVMLYLSTTTSVLPPTSLNVPLVTQFLTMLTIISVLSVVATVVTVYVHSLREKEQQERDKKSIGKVVQQLRRHNTTCGSSTRDIHGDATGSVWRGKTSRKVIPLKGGVATMRNGVTPTRIATDNVHNGSQVANDKGPQEECSNTEVSNNRLLDLQDFKNRLVTWRDSNSNKFNPDGVDVEVMTSQYPDGEGRIMPEIDTSRDHTSHVTRSRGPVRDYVFHHLDSIFFYSFLTVWVMTVMVYMILLFA